MWYSVDFYNQALNFQLTALRQPRMMAWIYAFVRPLVSLHTTWKKYRESNLYKLNHTGQVCYLRGALNDAFDPDLRRITIDGTGGESDKTYIFTQGENQPNYLGKLHLRGTLEYEDGADFTVFVPASIIAMQGYEVRALLDYYRLGGKRYLIIEI